MLAQKADIHLAITPGTDVVLQNALMYVILNENLEDRDYIAANTVGFEQLEAEVQKYDPASASAICGINEDMIRHVARVYAKADSAMSGPWALTKVHMVLTGLWVLTTST